MREKLYESFSFFLFISIIFLSIKIFNNSYTFDISKINLAFIYSKGINLNNLLNSNYTNKVDKEIVIINLKKDEYITNSSYICSINYGVVNYVDMNQIIINQNNGYKLFYIGLFEPNIKKGDYVEKDTIIATYYDSFNLYFTKDNIQYDYQEYIKNTI